MHLKYNTALLLFICFVFFLSCADKRDVLVQRQIERAIDLGEEQPQVALLILDSIQNPDDLDEENYMLYQIADVRANRNVNNLIREDQTKSIIKASTFFENKGDTKNAFLANYYTARAYRFQYDRQVNTAQELTHYLKAYSYAEKMNDSLSMGKTLYNIGLMYAEQNIFDSTETYIKRALPLFKENTTYQTQAYRLLAFIYYTNKNKEQSLYYLDKGEPLLKEKANKRYSYLYNSLYGIIYQDFMEYDKAINYFEKNMSDNISEKEKVRTALSLIDIYISINKLDSAKYYVEYAEPKLNNIQENELLLFAYIVLQEYYLEFGDTSKAKEYLNLFGQMQNIIKKQNEAETLFITSREFRIDQLEKSQAQYKKMLCYLIGSILVVIGLFLFIIRRESVSRNRIIREQKKIIEDLKKGELG